MAILSHVESTHVSPSRNLSNQPLSFKGIHGWQKWQVEQLFIAFFKDLILQLFIVFIFLSSHYRTFWTSVAHDGPLYLLLLANLVALYSTDLLKPADAALGLKRFWNHASDIFSVFIESQFTSRSRFLWYHRIVWKLVASYFSCWRPLDGMFSLVSWSSRKPLHASRGDDAN